MKVRYKVVFKRLVDCRLADSIFLLKLFFLTENISNVIILRDKESEIGFDFIFNEFCKQVNRTEGILGEEKS